MKFDNNLYTVPVQFEGVIEYDILADSEKEAKQIAEDIAKNEERFGNLKDVRYKVMDLKTN